MTEDEARTWLVDVLGVPRETILRLELFARLLLAETDCQNLISASTRKQLWSRHIVDSAQLIPLATAAKPGPWLDLGSGAGFPGIIAALLTDRETVLVEERKRRAEFLATAAEALGIGKQARIEQRKLSALAPFPAAVISARAFAPLDRLFAAAHPFSRAETLWLLPKGRTVRLELAVAEQTWQGAFHVEQSVTDADSAIVVARGVKQK